MKNIKWWVVAVLSCCGVGLLAATMTNALSMPPVTPLPQTRGEYWDLLIIGLSPLIVGVVYKIVPGVPKWLLPTCTPFIGIILGLGINRLAGAHLTWVDMAKAGALAVFVREVWNQAVTKTMAKPKPTLPPLHS